MKRVQAIFCVIIAAFLMLGIAVPSIAFLYVPQPIRAVFFVAPLGSVPDDGVPRMFCVVAKDRDAWVRNADRTCGRLYLVRNGDEIRAFRITTSRGTLVAVNIQTNAFVDGCFGVQFNWDGSVRHEENRGFMMPLHSVPVRVNAEGIWMDSLPNGALPCH